MADVTWRVTPQVSFEYDQLTGRILEIEPWSEEYIMLLDEIRSLPGYPQHYSEEHDTIRRVAVDTPRVGYTGTIRSS